MSRHRRGKKGKKSRKTQYDESKILQKLQTRDIVFLAIVSAICLVTCAVMPIVASLQTVIFGIAQVVTSFQISLFFSVGLMRVRKSGALLIMAVLMGLIQLMMAPPMFFSNIVVGVIVEALVLLIFRGFKSDKAVFFAAFVFNPFSIPFSVIYNYLFGRAAMVAVLTRVPWITVVMIVIILFLSWAGAYLGIKISRELKKSGVMRG